MTKVIAPIFEDFLILICVPCETRNINIPKKGFLAKSYNVNGHFTILSHLLVLRKFMMCYALVITQIRVKNLTYLTYSSLYN